MSYIAGPIRPVGGGAGSNSFATFQTDNGSSPTATSPTDVMTLTSSDKSVSITGNSGTDTIDFSSAIETVTATPTGTCTVDWGEGVLQVINLSDDLALTMSNGQIAGNVYILRIVDSSGGHTPTWDSSVKWAGGTAPGATTAGDTILVNMYYDGTNYLSTFAVFPA